MNKELIERLRAYRSNYRGPRELTAAAADTIEAQDKRIAELHDQNKRMRAILKMIGYPARGTQEESADLQWFADLVQKTYTLEQLQE